MSASRSWVLPGVLTAGAFVVGLVAGGLGPRAEVRRLEGQVAELQDRAKRARSTDRITDLLTQGLDDLDGPTPAPRRVPSVANGEAAPGDPPAVPDAPVRPGRDTDSFPLPDREATTPRDSETQLRQARELLEARRVQARAALLERANPTGAQLDAIDAAYDDMNAELLVIARDVVADVREQGDPGRREAMRLGADVLDVLVVAEERALGALDDDQRRRLPDESTDPTSFIDPEVVDVLLELEELRR